MFLCRNSQGISQRRVHEDYRLPSVFKRLRVESLIVPSSYLTVHLSSSYSFRIVRLIDPSSIHHRPAELEFASFPLSPKVGTKENRCEISLTLWRDAQEAAGSPRLAGMSSWHVTPWPWLAQLQRPPWRGSSSGARIHKRKYQFRPSLQSSRDRVSPAAAGAGQT